MGRPGILIWWDYSWLLRPLQGREAPTYMGNRLETQLSLGLDLKDNQVLLSLPRERCVLVGPVYAGLVSVVT